MSTPSPTATAPRLTSTVAVVTGGSRGIGLAIATAFLLGFRIATNAADSGVIDVGYSGVVGADRILHGEPLYGENEFPEDNPFGDTYGPVNYYTYIPFELALPWSGGAQ